MNICEAGHKKHNRLTVPTDIGDMVIYDSKKYMGFKGYCTGQDDISKTIEMYGRWEVEETAVVREVLEAGDRHNLFVDIGSHIGWFSRLAQEYGYAAIAYEADKENIELFSINTEGKAEVHHIWFDENTPAFEPIDRKIELLKIDIEGAERHAIAALKNWLPQVQNILIEVSPTFNDSYPYLIKMLQESGFKAYYMSGMPFDDDYSYSQTNLLLRRVES